MSISREQWRERLLRAELPETVVDELLKSLKDEDLVRMKDMSSEEIVEALRQAVQKADDEVACPKCGAMNPADAIVCSECDASLKEETPAPPPAEEKASPKPAPKKKDALPKEETGMRDVGAFVQALGDYIVSKVKDAMEKVLADHQINVEVPQLDTIVADMQAMKDELAGVTAVMKDVSTSDADRLRVIVGNLSPAQRSRLMSGISEAEAAVAVASHFKDDGKKSKRSVQPGQPDDEFRPVFRDSEGNDYESASAMANSGARQ